MCRPQGGAPADELTPLGAGFSRLRDLRGLREFQSAAAVVPIARQRREIPPASGCRSADWSRRNLLLLQVHEDEAVAFDDGAWSDEDWPREHRAGGDTRVELAALAARVDIRR